MHGLETIKRLNEEKTKEPQDLIGRHLTEKQIREILASPGTHSIVIEILDLLWGKDPCDNLRNLALVTTIVNSRLEGLKS